MNGTLSQLVPLFILFAVGATARWRGLITPDRRDFLLRLLFFVAVPALILDKVPQAQLTAGTFRLPLGIWLIALPTLAVATLVARAVTRERRQRGVLVVGSMILNSGFLLPFVIALYPADGIARFQLMDLGNGLLTQTLVYGLAAYYGQQKPDVRAAVRRLSYSPPLWALLVALGLLALNLRLPGVLQDTASTLGGLVGPLVLLALGASLNFRVATSRLVFVGVGLSLGCGILFSRLISSTLGLQGIDRELMLLVGLAPVGYNTLLFSSLEKLDQELASAIVSWSLIVGLITIPLWLLISQS